MPFSQPVKLAMMLIVLLMLSFLLASCQTTGSVGINTVGICTVFKPITWSKQDTVETAKQIIEHNAAWKSVCGK